MGVKGLNIFVRSICPTVFKEIPGRLEGIRGKKIVIDGTLVTQRFYYARKDYPHRHIQGWFRLARELEKSGISAICVFDGKERSVAKAQEVQRRRDARRLVGVRWSFENARFQRLNKLKEGIGLLQSLSSADRQRVSDALNEPSFTDSKTATLLQQELMNGQPVTPNEALASSPTKIQAAVTAESTTGVSPDDVIPMFKSLSVSYKAGLAKLVRDAVGDETKNAPAPDDLEQLMTKKQLELTVQEGNIWEEIVHSFLSPASNIDSKVERDISALVQHSHEMVESFDRRRHAPHAQIYSESQEILQAMGIPCIQTTAGIEAEALASSIVLAGHADFVASEDSDVMVYEANLLKNITSHDLPLVSVSGLDMRTSLGLSREQFLDFALLLGTDFTDRILQIGPTRAYRFIKEHGTIEAVVQQIRDDPKHKPSVSWDAYLAQVEVARLVFKTLPPIPSLGTLQPISKDDALTTQVLRKYNFSFTTMTEDNWDYAVAYAEILGQNYFGDRPSTAPEQ